MIKVLKTKLSLIIIYCVKKKKIITAMLRELRKLFALILLSTVGILIILWSLSTSFKNIFCGDMLVYNRTSLLCQLAPYLSCRQFGLVESTLINSNRIRLEINIANLTDTRDGSEFRKCPDILSGMVKGRWITRSLTQKEQITIETYLQEERGSFKIPSTYQRGDGQCGDVTYKKSPQYKHMLFRAICDPKGPTPCCRTNRCVALTEKECRCPTCYDERQAIHAEYAQWKPMDDRCGVRNFIKEEACKVLNGTTLYFVGDSFMRHVFAALVVMLTNDIDGALKKSTHRYYREKCTYMHQITGLICRDFLDQDRLLCNGTVKITYNQVFSASEMNLTLPLLRTLRHVNKSTIIFGLGIHDNFNVTRVANSFLLPFLNLHQLLSTNLASDVTLEEVLKSTAIFNDSAPNVDKEYKKIVRSSRKDTHIWPHLLWIGIHAPGLLKSPQFKEQAAEGVQNFNKGMYNILNKWKVPYLDTFGFTEGTVSFDGTHYGWGINMMKVNMLLTYIQEGFYRNTERR